MNSKVPSHRSSSICKRSRSAKLSEDQVSEVHHSMLEVLGLDHLIDHLLDAARLKKDCRRNSARGGSICRQSWNAASPQPIRLYRLQADAITLKLQAIPILGHAKELGTHLSQFDRQRGQVFGQTTRASKSKIYTPSNSTLGCALVTTAPVCRRNCGAKFSAGLCGWAVNSNRKQAGTGLGYTLCANLSKACTARFTSIAAVRCRDIFRGRTPAPACVICRSLPGPAWKRDFQKREPTRIQPTAAKKLLSSHGIFKGLYVGGGNRDDFADREARLLERPRGFRGGEKTCRNICGIWR